MTTHSLSSWSELLQWQTCQAIKLVVVALDEHVCFKHPIQGYEYAGVDDLCHERLALHLQWNGEQRRFDSVDALLQAGWAVD